MNITNTIWRNCHAYPDRVAFLYDGRSISYKTLGATIEQVSARLAAAGVTRGDVVGLTLTSNLVYLVLLLSAVRLGAIATPLARGYRDELIARLGVHTVVLDKDDGWRSDSLPSSRFLNANMLLPHANDKRLEVPPVAQGLDDQPWIISLSSGTTGTPKSYPLTHANGLVTIALWPHPNQDDEEGLLVYMGLGILYGIRIVMHQLYSGKTTVLTSFPKTARFFTTVERDRPTHVVTTVGTASELVAYAAHNVPESVAVCSGIRSFMVAGAAVSPALREGITSRICQGLWVVYGATEAGSLALSTPETHAAHPGSAGRLNAWVQAEAVDENDRPLPEGRRGLLRFKSPFMTNSYVGDEQASLRAFRNGWFYPGDTGVVHPAGYLFLGGRIDHVLNFGGNKIDAHLIEKLLNEQPAIVESAVVAVDSEMGSVLVAAVEARGPFDSAALKRLCLDRLGKIYVPQFIIKVDALPRNQGGKVMRSVLAEGLKISKKEPTTP